MLITLDKVSNARKEGKWAKLDIEYTRDGGKSSKKTLVGIGETLKIMSAFRDEGAVGAQWEIDLKTVEKDGQTYYNWIGAKKVEGGAVQEAKSAYKAKSTYETPEERAARNVSICRQNALTNAVVFLNAKNSKASVDEVISVAREFAAFTSGNLDVTLRDEAEQYEDQANSGITDDIPF
jgi:uncharacterized ParB-like nuclease family protein